MAIDLKTVEQLAPDQSALKAAAGLAKPGKWSAIGASDDGALIWGECAGSGANPYRVMADLRDHGNKCTCPSRKFPCKHVLALFWLNAEAILPFPVADTPDYVSDWLGRRRGGAPKPADSAAAPKSVDAARAVEAEAREDPKAAARREAAAVRRAEDTGRAILDALDALDQWIGDQLRRGLAGFIDDATTRCRRIAARLVDGKAAALAGRIDELPGRLMALPAGDRVRGAVIEFGKLVLLARAFRAEPGSAELRRAIATAESREALQADETALRVIARWEVVGEEVETRRDGLVSQTSWLLNLDEGDGPRFAMLLDFFPASAGRRGSAFAVGDQFEGELLFYPARVPLRALLLARGAEPAIPAAWPAAAGPLTDALNRPLLVEPWALDIPVLLPAGRVAADTGGRAWWRSADGATVLPLAETPTGLVRGTDLERTAAIWSGAGLRLLTARTPWGRVAIDG
ncbi:SWIM zinc finger family protein [Sphingomonas sanxanigenens]|uniref:SWIM zinc finger family protein n=1 Tax=Sphingomonas sanxanigenens TaxID=397260 RepID=UPI00046C90C0|nr:SWIM zinc finger family protein [Sphingomonas sanxanigenens]